MAGKIGSLCLALSFVMLLTSCATMTNPVDQRRKARAEVVGADLKTHGRASKYFRDSPFLTDVGGGIRVLSNKDKMEVHYYCWPMGPSHVLDVTTGEWSFEE